MTEWAANLMETPLGKQKVDNSGPPVAVVRLDAAKSYSGTAELLQKTINDSDPESWGTIKSKIDYTVQHLGAALEALDAETGFGRLVRNEVDKGKKLLFKPNLVNPSCIDPETHGPDVGRTACTEWPFVAALMRSFHDVLEIRYHQMALGEAATCMSAAAGYYSQVNPQRLRITTEAAIEGKVGDFHCGWGFYFARKYLAESLPARSSDDPMQGYAESLSGTYIPPGRAAGKLMVYDLNRLFDDPSKAREVHVPGGVNFKSVTLHKAVVGGSPDDPEDRRNYPGAILVNVPKFKVHAIALFTNVLKNLGIGLYPMEWAKEGGVKWEYSLPQNALPGMKAGIPHHIWVSELDPSGIPKRSNGGYAVRETGGINATMTDILKAVKNQGTFMIHVVDGIEAVNLDHQGVLPGVKVPEGMVFAGLDPVATDLLCARYMFSNVPLKEAVEAGLEDGAGGKFPQKVPVPALEGGSIVTRSGYDCPLARDRFFAEAEEAGLGVRKYRVVGRDAISGRRLVSLQGHLGTEDNGIFSDVFTTTLYFDVFKLPWDLQKTAFEYFSSVDYLTGSSLKNDFIRAFAENGNGTVAYDHFGKKGYLDLVLAAGADSVSEMGTNPLGYFKGVFIQRSKILKAGEPGWNAGGHDILREVISGAACFTAYRMSEMGFESPDPFVPKLTWGKGKWPSYKLARFMYIGVQLFGMQFPFKLSFPSLYGAAFRYADLTQNDGRRAGKSRTRPDPEALAGYSAGVQKQEIRPLDFVLYVPAEYHHVAGAQVPNVEITADPEKMFTASFMNGREVWKAM